MENVQKIGMDELPEELYQTVDASVESIQWHDALLRWAKFQLMAGRNDIAKAAQTTFETVLIHSVMDQCNGHRNQAAKRLGYGRNTLTRKIKELQLEL